MDQMLFRHHRSSDLSLHSPLVIYVAAVAEMMVPVDAASQPFHDLLLRDPRYGDARYETWPECYDIVYEASITRLCSLSLLPCPASVGLATCKCSVQSFCKLCSVDFSHCGASLCGVGDGWESYRVLCSSSMCGSSKHGLVGRHCRMFRSRRLASKFKLLPLNPSSIARLPWRDYLQDRKRGGGSVQELKARPGRRGRGFN